ncbi:putative siroheme synthase [Phaeomoniella chlamydospora]|uniref:Putative siroheme synthase n=1 Tax=Phaeomoniella chlamydospora TaxID=158046 RepID=A0A0G2EFG1_PHACM|nr:putative siroheme synthase [Phaeomoniella chlamydospora]
MHAPLLTALDCVGQIHLILGSGPIAAARAAKSIEVGATPIVISSSGSDVHYTLAKRIEDGQVKHIIRDFQDQDLGTLGREEVDCVVDAVFVTASSGSTLGDRVSKLCRRMRIPVNVADAPNLCTFSILSTHTDGPLQIGITTSGRGCKLSSRIRREIASSLPPNFGEAIERLGNLRRRIIEEDHAVGTASENLEVDDDDVYLNQKHTFNALVRPTDSDPSIARNRRMRWLSQICEYWPLSRLASINDADAAAILSAYTSAACDRAPVSSAEITSRIHRPGKVTLAGSGPGHPDLLTRATFKAIKSADLILADKLVPAPVLDLIPRRTPVHIARKFPGNADAAQEELLSMGLEAARQGKHVLRLKQGDPYLYGRGAEEFAFFESHGFAPSVLPGITSAFSAPLFAAIPPTHRAVSDQVLVCTGTGRKGAAPSPPSYNKSQTVVFLMALHRLESLVTSLTNPVSINPEPKAGVLSNDSTITANTTPGFHPWPKETPCAIIERASCPDQRVIRTTLEHAVKAMEEEGSRPPGLLVVGWSCEVLKKLNKGVKWVAEDGFRGIEGFEEQSGLDGISDLEREPVKVDSEQMDFPASNPFSYGAHRGLPA